jgi:pyridinium-3,5-biscarboxylic acid mononucleotide synthase
VRTAGPVPFARLDHHRRSGRGTRRWCTGPGKTIPQLLEICRRFARRGDGFLVTRLEPAPWKRWPTRSPAAPPAPGLGRSSSRLPGPGDSPPASQWGGPSSWSPRDGGPPGGRGGGGDREAFGNPVDRLYDVGVAGIHRVLGEAARLREAAVVIVVAGMEGALPSVVGGLVGCPVIAVPTSVGYGAAFGGIAPLLGMLNSCAAGVTVVNIDNGFGAAVAATRINQAARLQDILGARRLVLWTSTVQGDGTGSVLPWASTGPLPMGQPGAGSPLAWCSEQGQPLRLDPRPAWAEDEVVAAPVGPADDRSVLTVEGAGATTGPHDDDGLAAATGAAAIVATVLSLERGGEQARGEVAGRQRLLDFLRALPTEADPSAFPDTLAAAAAHVAVRDGALVASWDPDAGQEHAPGGRGAPRPGGGVVLARCGQAGGPEPGRPFGDDPAGEEGDLVLAARAQTTLDRDRRTTDRPLAGRDERWGGRPRFTTIVPLLDPTGRCGGLVALWGATPPDPDAVAFLEALAPLLAVQLRHSLDLARFRDRADRDALTGLPNRAAFDDRLALETQRFHRYRRPLALLVLDLDHFKAVNDTYGHPAGDAVLQRVGDILRANTRDPDLPARYGGEEMVVVLPETMLLQAREVAERIRGAIEDARFEHDGHTLHVTASIGVSACPECIDEPGRLMATADDALYQAKHAGRNRVAVVERAEGGEGAEADHRGERRER